MKRVYQLMISRDDGKLVRVDSYGVYSEGAEGAAIDAEAMEQLAARLLSAARLRRVQGKRVA